MFMKRSLKIKDQIELGIDIDKYLETILKKYESFVNQRYDEFCHFCKKAEKNLTGKLFWSYYPIREEKEIRNDQIELIKKTERKIAKKQKEIEREKDEKRKLLILAIKKIRGV